jgi:hypothetical protein
MAIPSKLTTTRKPPQDTFSDMVAASETFQFIHPAWVNAVRALVEQLLADQDLASTDFAALFQTVTDVGTPQTDSRERRPHVCD